MHSYFFNQHYLEFFDNYFAASVFFQSVLGCCFSRYYMSPPLLQRSVAWVNPFLQPPQKIIAIIKINYLLQINCKSAVNEILQHNLADVIISIPYLTLKKIYIIKLKLKLLISIFIPADDAFRRLNSKENTV